MNKSTCIHNDCVKPQSTREYCHAHYEFLRSTGQLPPKKCRGCENPCPGNKHYCSPECKPKCSIKGCEKFTAARGWCSFHYTRWKLTGDPNTPLSKLCYADKPACKFDNCSSPARKIGYCNTHYGQAWHGREMAKAKPKNMPIPGLDGCCIRDCGGEVYGNYLCQTHYRRMQNTGSTKLFIPTPKVCRYPKCGKPVEGNGWCLTHYKRIKVSGTPFERDMPSKNRMSASKKGYVREGQLRRHVGAIVERDGTACGICGSEVDLNLQHPDLMSRSVDHIIPWSLGGPNHISNYQLSHLVCNIRKGNKL